MWERIKSFFAGLRDVIEGWLDRWIIRIYPNEPVEGHGIFRRLLRIGEFYKSTTIFMVAAIAIGVVIFLAGGILGRAFWSMALVFGGLFLILLQVKAEKRRTIMATLVKNRLWIDIAATALAIGAVFGGAFGVTISFTWAFTMIGISALISVFDFFGRTWWGKNYVEQHAWKLDTQKTLQALSPKPNEVVDAEFTELPAPAMA